MAGVLAITGIPESEFDTGISANGQPSATGDAGVITINAGSVTIDAAATDQNQTYGSGNGGDVTLNVAGTLAISGAPDSGFVTGISADSQLGATGDAGTVTIDAGSITIDETGQISSNTIGSGNGGDVTVNVAGALTITGDPAFGILYRNLCRRRVQTVMRAKSPSTPAASRLQTAVRSPARPPGRATAATSPLT